MIREGLNLRDEFKVPELGENVAGGDVTRVLVKVGDTIAREQPVLELETDKATIEVPSSVAGVVKEIRVKKGDKIKVGAVVLTVDAPLATARPQRWPSQAGGGAAPAAGSRHRPGGEPTGCRGGEPPCGVRDAAPAAAAAPRAGAGNRARHRPHRRSARRAPRLAARCDAWRVRSASTSTRSRDRSETDASRRRTSRSTRGAF